MCEARWQFPYSVYDVTASEHSILSTNRFTFCLLGKNVWFNQTLSITDYNTLLLFAGKGSLFVNVQ